MKFFTPSPEIFRVTGVVSNSAGVVCNVTVNLCPLAYADTAGLGVSVYALPVPDVVNAIADCACVIIAVSGMPDDIVRAPMILAPAAVIATISFGPANNDRLPELSEVEAIPPPPVVTAFIVDVIVVLDYVSEKPAAAR